MNAYHALYRVDEVLKGHSDRVLVVAHDHCGAELRVDLPLAHARDLEVGLGLVVLLSAHCLPQCPRPGATAPDPAAPTPEPVPLVRDPAGESTRLDGPQVADERTNVEICRMLGLA